LKADDLVLEIESKLLKEVKEMMQKVKFIILLIFLKKTMREVYDFIDKYNYKSLWDIFA